MNDPASAPSWPKVLDIVARLQKAKAEGRHQEALELEGQRYRMIQECQREADSVRVLREPITRAGKQEEPVVQASSKPSTRPSIGGGRPPVVEPPVPKHTPRPPKVIPEPVRQASLTPGTRGTAPRPTPTAPRNTLLARMYTSPPPPPGPLSPEYLRGPQPAPVPPSPVPVAPSVKTKPPVVNKPEPAPVRIPEPELPKPEPLAAPVKIPAPPPVSRAADDAAWEDPKPEPAPEKPTVWVRKPKPVPAQPAQPAPYRWSWERDDQDD